MLKKNCWEVKECGRYVGGVKVKEMGVCPASTVTSVAGKNGGKNGGRICWLIAGTLCHDKIQGTFAKEQVSCLACDFFNLVKKEEGSTFRLLR